jgi:hypothetical protein
VTDPTPLRPDVPAGTEDRLRQAISSHTSTVEPRPGSLERIQEALMDTRSDQTRNRALLGGAAVVVLLALVAGAFFLLGDDDDEGLDVADETTTTTTDTTAPDETTTTTETDTTTETAPPPEVGVDLEAALFPDPLTSQRFTDPQSAAFSFATDMVGMADPQLGEFQQGDSRSGEVEVQAFDGGPVTLVLVRQLEDDSWFVIGAMSSEIELDEPQQGDEIGSTFTASGRARAFEGTVPVRVFGDGAGELAATVDGFDSAFVTGSGGPDLGPFDEEISVEVPDGVTHGVVLLITEGGEDFAPISATAVRIRFTG